MKTERLIEKELIELAINWFERIEEQAERLTSGNVSHNGQAILGYARNAAEFLRKHREESDEAM